MIFIDTGAFLARWVTRDQYHSAARAIWQKLQASTYRCFTSNFVLDETFTLLGRRTSFELAARRARSLMSSSILEILRPTQEDELQALRLFEKFADQRVSFTDCVSFALMRKHRLSRAFSFDRHFAYAGFELWSNYAGTVHEPHTEYDP